MITELEHLKIVRDNLYYESHRKELKRMVRDFLDSAGYSQSKFKQCMETVEAAVAGKMGLILWVYDNGVDLGGYALTINTIDENSDKIFIICHAYLDKKLRNNGTAKKCLNAFMEFGKQAGCKKVTFYVRNRRKAYKKFLGSEWNYGPAIFERTLR